MFFGAFFGMLCFLENLRRNATDQTAQILIIGAELGILKTLFHGVGCRVFKIILELGVFGSQRLERCIIFLHLRLELLCAGKKTAKQRDKLFSCLLRIKGRKPAQKLHDAVCLPGQVRGLFVYARGDMRPAGHAGAFTALQIGKHGNHVGKEIVLPLNELCAVADDLFCA